MRRDIRDPERTEFVRIDMAIGRTRDAKPITGGFALIIRSRVLTTKTILTVV